MPCLYVCAGQIDHVFGPYTLLKYGISKHTEPWKRCKQHAQAAHNPWSCDLDLEVALSIAMDSTEDALVVEDLIKTHAWLVLPQQPLAIRPDVMSVAKTPGLRPRPSCEWMMHPAGVRYAVMDMIGFALLALSQTRRYSNDSWHVTENAYGAFARAGFGWAAGGGYAQVDMRSEHN